MARNRKKKGPAPVQGSMTRKTWKDTCRRIIRLFMVVLGAFLLLVALAIPVINNAIALGVEKELKDLPLPERTVLVESSSVAGRIVEAEDEVQYYGALLVKSELPVTQLAAYYGALDSTAIGSYTVVPYTGENTQDPVVKKLPLTTKTVDEGCFIVYRRGKGSSLWQSWLNMDLR